MLLRLANINGAGPITIMQRLATFLQVTAGRRGFSQSRTKILITGSGKDRLGIVRDLSGLVWAGQGNIMDSCMARMAGQFVIMMLADMPEETVFDFQFELAKNRDLQGLNLTVKAAEDECRRVGSDPSTLRLDVEGADNPGVLHHIASVLANHEVNINDLTTTCETAPMGGTQLFCLHGYVQLPPNLDLNQVRAELAKTSSDLGVEVTLSET